MEVRSSERERITSLYGGFWNFDFLDFCYMTNRYFPPEDLLRSIEAQAKSLITSYPSTNVHVSSLVSELLGVKTTEVVVSNGASELIAAITTSLITTVAVPTPTFEEFANRAMLQGKTVSPYQLKGDFTLDVERFVEHVRDSGANSAVIVNPNNPTGNLIPRQSMERLLNALSTLDLVLVDESFLEFAESPTESSLLDSIGYFPNLVIIKSMSKCYGVPGLRLGHAVSSNQAVISDIRAQLPIWNINSLAQFFLELLGHYLQQYKESCLRVRDATQMLYRDLCRIPNLYPYPSQGNFILCRVDNGTDATALSSHLFDEHKILVNNRSGKSGLDHRFFRVATRTTEENQYLVSALKQSVSALG